MGVRDGNGGSRRSVVGETRLGEELERMDRIVEEGRAEALNGFEGDAGEGVERNEVAVDLVGLRDGHVGHAR